jgi:CDP-glycerol glycerophosphotransferase (TagB/SpsB family)
MEKVVVSLTSYPLRINAVNKVIESLFKQTEKADEIILWLSKVEFPNRELDLPDNLKCLIGRNGFRIEWVNGNLKSHKKYYYVLQQNISSVVITVDDDMYYSSGMIHMLMDSYRKHSNAISARKVRLILRGGKSLLPYIEWKRECFFPELYDEERYDFCAIGSGGILYPPGCASKGWFDVNEIIECAENQDDLWLKYNQIIDNIPIVCTGTGESDIATEMANNESAMFIHNCHGGANDIAISKLINRLKCEYKLNYSNLLSYHGYVRELINHHAYKLYNKLNGQTSKKYIAGAGIYAKDLFTFLKSYGYENLINAFVVSDGNVNDDNLYGIDVKSINDLDKSESMTVLCGVSSLYEDELKKEFEQFKHFEWVSIDYKRIWRLLGWEEDTTKMPIEERKFVFYTMGNYSGHGKAIAESLLKKRDDLDIVWVVNKIDENIPKDVRQILKNDSKQYKYEMATAKYWVYDYLVPLSINKRPGQVFIQTKHWSSITLKTFGLGLYEFRNDTKLINICKHNSNMMDYVLVGSKFDEMTCREGFEFKGEAVYVGSPRSDILFDSREIKRAVFKHYNIEEGRKIALFAPTFRLGDKESGKKFEIGEVSLDYTRILEALETKFGGVWSIMLRLHPNIALEGYELAPIDGVIDASSYEEGEELVASSDIMITDYSSIMFEPAFVRKPVFLYVPDRNEYINKERSLLIDYDSLPFPIAVSNEELICNVLQFDKEKYDKKVNQFMEKYGVFEDGHASERAAKFIIELIEKE